MGKGIPFAATTGGENRWKAPKPRVPWNQTLVADSFGSACPAGMTPPGSADTVYNEDCLNLNIWSSANSTAEKRPVMIWSYPAGANGAWSMFDGGGFALKDIVVVTYNYRTGPYGWLALPELWEESGNLTTDSYALLDQIAALRNGCMRTLRLLVVIRSASPPLASPLAKGIIAGAIAESGIRAPRDPASINLAEGYNNMTTNHLVVFGRQVQINPQCHDSRRASQGPSKNNPTKTVALLDFQTGEPLWMAMPCRKLTGTSCRRDPPTTFP